jgi:bifunctional enzyme CysN/CysC
VQYVNRPHLNFRGYCGTIASGIVRRGDEVMVLPSRKTSRVESIVTYEGEHDEAFAPLAVTLTLEDEIDVSRGDMIVRPGNVPKVAQDFEAMVVWMAEEQMVPGKQYLFKQSTRTTPGAVTTMRYQVDVNTLHRRDAPTLSLNEIGRCSVSVDQPLNWDGYRRNRSTGAFIVIDRITNVTVGAGMILDRATGDQKLDHWDDEPRSASLHREASEVTADERRARYGQQPVTVLLTGLTGAGKTTLANALERRLFDSGRASVVLDGQHMRLGISKDLGFSNADRSENLRRSAEVAKLMNDGGLICIAAFVAPSEEVRQRAKVAIGADRTLIVHLDAPLEVCRERDADGHYERADSGEWSDFPGVTAPYESPVDPDLVLQTAELNIGECVDQVVDLLVVRGFTSG